MLKGLLPSKFFANFTRRSEALALSEQKQFFEENGYLILRGMFSPERIADIRRHVDALWENRVNEPKLVIDAYFGTSKACRTYFRKTASDVREHPYKLNDVHLEDEKLRDLCTDPRLIQTLKSLLGATPMVCNTLLFERGSQQDPHFDTFFMPSKTKNMMAASWIALEKVTETNGPLYYYPKSHLIEPYRFSHGGISAIFSELATGAAAHIDQIVKEHGLKREIFLPEAGDVLIWHAQLLHGGDLIKNPAETRLSLVTHYWTELDYPEADQRIDLGNGRWMLRKSHQTVIDDDVMAEVEEFFSTLTISQEALDAVPESFNPRMYLAWNQDVLRARVDPYHHYLSHGRAEGRIW